MSVLSYIGEYGSSSGTEDSDIEQQLDEQPKNTRVKLPAPNLERIQVVKVESHTDDPELHGGRVCNFAHVRGNWATFVYIKYPQDEKVINLIQRLEAATQHIGSLERIEDLHVSLSRTVVLNFHLITTFNSSLKEALENIPSFHLELDSIKVYCNDDCTRTFIALKADYLGSKNLVQLMKQVDAVLREFNLPEFYEDPSFHASILWMHGDRKEELTQALEEFINPINQVGLNSTFINKVNCKIGNKQFQYLLD